MRRVASILIVGGLLLQMMGACGVSADSPGPSEDLSQRRERVLSNEPLVVPSDTVLPTEQTVSGTAVGQVATAFNVSADGDATYSLPLWVPEGRAGLQPSLTLGYSSHGGNGLLGMGWKVSGLSQIYRCRKTFAQDGETAPVRFTSDDALCLDGQRLMAVGSTSTTTEFRTEVESFTKVIAYRDASGAPDYFEAYLKDGRILSYGRFPDTHSRLEGLRWTFTANPYDGSVTPGHESSPVRLAWSLSEVRDRSGNDMRISYLLQGDADAGYEHVPDRIDYTGHTSDPTGNLRRRSVRFEYVPGSRPDSDVQYVSGLKLHSTKRLHRIVMYGPGLASTPTTRDDVPLRSYEFSYRNDTITRRSLLESIFECDGQGVCHDPLEFDYESGFDCGANPDNDCSDPIVQAQDFSAMTAVEIVGSSLVPITDVKTRGTGTALGQPVPGVQDFWALETLDINGDGRDDLLYRRNDNARIVDSSTGPVPDPGEGQWYFRLATGSPNVFGPATLANLPKSKTGSSDDDLRIVDMDGDGVPEVLALQQPDPAIGQDGYFQLYRFNGTTFQPVNIQAAEVTQFWWQPSSPATEAGRFPVLHLADLNGDGLPEMFRSTQQPQAFDWGYRMNRGGLSLSPYFQVPLKSGLDYSGYTVDVDGDGSTEVLVRASITNDQRAPDGFSAQYMAVGVGAGDTSRYAATTLAAGPVASTGSDLSMRWHFNRTWFVDINGDGLPDAVSARRDRDTGSAGKLYGDLLISINTGNGFAPPIFQNLDALHELSPSWISETTRGLDPGVRVLDFDHDGRQDLLLTDSGESNANGATRQNMWVLLARDDHFEPRELSVPVGQTTGGTASSKPYGYGQRFSQLLDVNGDGFEDIVQVEGDPNITDYQQREWSGILRMYVRKGRHPDVMTGVREGKQGKAVQVRYQHLLDSPGEQGQPQIYTRGTCSYPQQCVTHGLWVVVESGVDDGRGTSTFNTFYYSYEAARLDVLGRGWLGFAKRTFYNNQTKAKTTTTFDNQTRDGTLYLRKGLPALETTELELTPGGVKHLSTRDHHYTAALSSSNRPFLYADTTTEEFREGSGSSLPLTRRRIHTQSLDAYGNSTSTQQDDVELDQGVPTGRVWRERTVVPAIDNIESSWLIGLPRRIEVTSTAFDGQSATRTTTYDYYPTGLLQTLVAEPGGGADFELKTVYFRNAMGLAERVERTGSGMTRAESTQYDGLEFQFPAVSFNAMGHRTRFARHPGLGVIAVAEDPNGLVTTFRYDGFGRPRATLTPTGADKTFQYGADTLGRMKITTSVAGGQQTITTLDNYGREVRRDVHGFDGSLISVTSSYDALGRKTAVSRPMSGTAPAQYTTMTYDLLDRPLTVLSPENTVITYVYDKLTTTRFDERNNKSTTVADAHNQLQSSSVYTADGREIRTTYVYGPFGQLRQVTDAMGNVASVEHDRLGRRNLLTDPDSGMTTTYYNAFGEPRRETDGSGNLTTYDEYDALGRQKKLTTKDGVTTFQWDTSVNGALGSATSPDGITNTIAYNDKGQLSENTWTIEGTTYRINRTYDSTGRLATLLYPEVAGRRLTLRYSYTTQGELKDVQDDVTHTVYWVAQGRNAYGELTSERLGNGVVTQRRYDPRGRLRFIDSRIDNPASPLNGTVLQGLAYEWDAEGNLLSRGDMLARTTEDFEYDTLDRLKKWTSYQNCRRSVLEYQYDDLGNLLERRVLEGSGTPTTGVYTGPGGGPHAVKQSQAGSYAYEGNGNQVSGPGRTVSYTAFDLPRRIADPGREVSFLYDASHARTVKRSSLNGVTTYVGGLYEKRQAGGQTRHVFSIAGAERVVAQVHWVETSGSITSEWPLYQLADHQGSTETVTDVFGNVVERQKFEPFGGRRLPYALTVAASVSSADTRQGFTGQEADDEFGLLNMRGRIYDPETARFLTPDPLVQFPHAGQSYNRYAYALNNPLRWTDPSGFEVDGPIIDSDAHPELTPIEIAVNAPVVDSSGVAQWGGGEMKAQAADQNGKTMTRNEFLAKTAMINNPNSYFKKLVHEGSGGPPLREFPSTEDDSGFQFVRHCAGVLLIEGMKFVVVDMLTDGIGMALESPLEGAVLEGSEVLEADVLEESAVTVLRGGCFVAGTPVLTWSGSKSIETVAVGDWVWSWDEVTKAPGWHQVSRTFIKPARVVLLIALVAPDGRTEEVGATPEHPFWVEGKGWTQAQELEPGDAVETVTGMHVHVRSLQMSAELATVYNLEVEQTHTYFVGTLSEWVHNNSLSGLGTPMQRAAAASTDPGLAAFVGRLENAGVNVRAINVKIMGPEGAETLGEIDVITDKALIQYKNGSSSAAEVIEQVRVKTEPFVSNDKPVVVFINDTGKAGTRTVNGAAWNGIYITNDFDTLVGAIR